MALCAISKVFGLLLYLLLGSRYLEDPKKGWALRAL